jgi:cytochrome c oxidase subunit 2
VGLVGPNLTHFGSRTTIAAGMLDNNSANLKLWLKDPEAVKPGNDMSTAMRAQIQQWGADADKNIDALVAYLMSLK